MRRGVALPLLFALGWRNIWRHRRRNVMLFGAIFVAVAGALLASALIRGYQQDMVDSAVENLTGHVKVLAAGYRRDPSIEHSFDLDPEWQPASGEHVAGWTARVRVPAVILSERETRGVTLVGIDPATERELSFLKEVAFDGEYLRDGDDHRVLIGEALADQLETAAGRRVVVMTQGADSRTREAGFRVAGVYDAEGTGLEKAFAFTGVAALQDLVDAERYTEVSLLLANDEFRERAKAQLKAEFDDDLEVLGWQELEPQTAAMIEYADGAVFIWLVVMLVALAFGLVNTLITAVMERTRELGMLRALGMRRSAVVAQVVIESCLIVLVGVALGVLAGTVLALALADGVDLTRWAAGVEFAGLRAVLVPRLLPGDVLVVVAMSLALGILASLYPAWRAVKVSPLDALRR